MLSSSKAAKAAQRVPEVIQAKTLSQLNLFIPKRSEIVPL